MKNTLQTMKNKHVKHKIFSKGIKINLDPGSIETRKKARKILDTKSYTRLS